MIDKSICHESIKKSNQIPQQDKSHKTEIETIDWKNYGDDEETQLIEEDLIFGGEIEVLKDESKEKDRENEKSGFSFMRWLVEIATIEDDDVI